jgi:hypothetical protein
LKLIRSNGRELEVREVGPAIFRLHARNVPIKLNGWRIVGDEEARSIVREQLATGLYEHDRGGADSSFDDGSPECDTAAQSTR